MDGIVFQCHHLVRVGFTSCHIINGLFRLDSFKFVSVRESWLQKELSEYYPGKISLCLDPVFLMDKKEWDLHIKNISLNLSRYVLIYSFDITEDEYKRIEKWANENKLKIIELITHKRIKRSTITYFDTI